MAKTFHLDPGYVTVPEANKIVLRILNVFDHEDKSHYNKILNGAKKGMFGGKKHGTRMYQVRKDDIIQYAEECLRDEKLKNFNIELVPDLKAIENSKNLTKINNKTSKILHYYLTYLRFHEIISEDVFHQAEKNIILRVNMNAFTKV
ncbi:hypothetical protein [Neobacillus cucumis]|uniref:hypothetical protein n=1 Tax=Neobacillus cucumis TaxID=1740721 RepID=UPI002853608D|nr:hypothetical protein [Neobacillus cucumis]MDR4947196.1 hypothetical protein [Neobacillus cucumis]